MLQDPLRNISSRVWNNSEANVGGKLMHKLQLQLHLVCRQPCAENLHQFSSFPSIPDCMLHIEGTIHLMMRHYSTSLQTSSNSRGSTWREAQKMKLTFPTHNVVPSLLLQRSSSWSQTPPAWALLDSTIPGCTTTCKLAPPTLSPGRLLAVKNSLPLSPFLHSEEQMRIGGDEGDKGWRDKAQRWK